jgi:hypothetical protein
MNRKRLGFILFLDFPNTCLPWRRPRIRVSHYHTAQKPYEGDGWKSGFSEIFFLSRLFKTCTAHFCFLYNKKKQKSNGIPL